MIIPAFLRLESLASGALLLLPAWGLSAAPLGLFESSGDIGVVAHQGKATHDPGANTYTLTGSGENMWGERDAFQFAWKSAGGDLALETRVQWVTTGGNAHRKAGLMFRQTLDADSPYVDAVVHGDGLTSLQYRDVKGGRTREVQTVLQGPQRLRLERRGTVFSLSVGAADSPLESTGCSIKLAFTDPLYVGLFVCAHDSNAVEQATFAEVKVQPLAAAAVTNRMVESSLEILPIASEDRRVIHRARQLFEAPNWSPNGQFLVFNQGGRLYRIPAAGGQPTLIDSGFADRCNNDHGISPDATQLVISHHQGGPSLIYVLPITGGVPRQVTPKGPSYWHGWSPDGKTLAYCAERNQEFDVYTIPVEGGEEKRLTTEAGLDDGPDYSPDGQWLYFNSERTGSMKIWRVRTDGSDPQQMTFGDYNDWFPHPSPDGRWVAFLSYDKDVKGHPANQDVVLRLMPLGGGTPKIVARLFGGQGTLNVPSWSPDSKSFAFVSYRLLPEEKSGR